MERRRLPAHPVEERPEPRMRAQRFRRREIPRKLRFGQNRMDFVVADLMDQDALALSAALQLGHEMMDGLLRLGRDRTQAERTDGIVHAANHRPRRWECEARFSTGFGPVRQRVAGGARTR